MVRHSLAAGVTILLALTAGSAAFGHGGQYRGPGDQVPPNLGGKGDTTPPGNPGGPVTPVPGAPRTGPGKGGPPGALNPGAGRTGRGNGFTRSRSNGNFAQWEFWWEHNKEPYLNLRTHLASRQSYTGSPGFMVGKGKQMVIGSSNRPDAEEIVRRYLPILVPLLKESQADVVDSSAIAIARMLRTQHADAVLEELVATLGHEAKTARESATLALGVLGSDQAVEVLTHLLLDTTEGRRLTGRGHSVEPMVRSFAAISLGMISMPESAAVLMQVVESQGSGSKADLKAMCIQALGQMCTAQEEIAPFLLRCGQDKSLERLVRAQAPIALAKLHEKTAGPSPAQAALPILHEQFTNPKTDLNLLRSLAISLGVLGTIQDEEVLATLFDSVKQTRDEQTRNFCLIALAQIGARDDAVQSSLELHQQISRFLLEELVHPSSSTNRPYAALALGIYGRNAEAPSRDAFIDYLMETFTEHNNPSHRGAIAIALGMLNALHSSEMLWEEFEDSHHQPLKGYLALSLGLMQAGKGEELRNIVSKPGLMPKYRLNLARALGLLGDSQAMDELITTLSEASTLAETSSAASALGLIGDKSAFELLEKIVLDKSLAPLRRGMAVAAIGLIGEKTMLPWSSSLSTNSNYRAKTPALAEIFDIL